MNTRILLLAISHIILIPWGLTGISSYYPVKYLVFKDKSACGPKADISNLIEFEAVFLSGPFAAPAYLLYKVHQGFNRRQQRVRQLFYDRRLKNQIYQITDDICRITSRYDFVEARSAADQLSDDLTAIGQKKPGRFGSTSTAAIECLERFLNKMYRRDKSIMAWRIAQSRSIVSDHRAERAL